MTKTTYIAIAAVIVIAAIVIGAIATTSYKSPGATTSTLTPGVTTSVYSVGRASQVPMMVTDPPVVPSGTSALAVSYSSVSVHTEGTAGSGWVNASGSGMINLMSAVNSSVIIGYANLTSGSSVNLARFNITAASITVNGTSYNVTVPNPTLTVAVTGQSKINQNSSVLVDITPTVVALYSDNATTFVLAPAARAVVVTSASTSQHPAIGAMISINANARAMLAATSQSIMITSASLKASGNVTTINVTVKNNSNASVTLTGLAIHGQQDVTVPASANGNATANANIRSVLHGGYLILGARAQAALMVGLGIQSFMFSFFMVTPSGALTLPSRAYYPVTAGATVAPGQSVSLTYAGTVAYNNGMFQSNLVSGSQYAVDVVGENGVRGSTTVTAG